MIITAVYIIGMGLGWWLGDALYQVIYTAICFLADGVLIDRIAPGTKGMTSVEVNYWNKKTEVMELIRRKLNIELEEAETTRR